LEGGDGEARRGEAFFRQNFRRFAADFPRLSTSDSSHFAYLSHFSFSGVVFFFLRRKKSSLSALRRFSK
jgi:hypothetical protein